MGISIEDMKKAVENGKVADSIERIRWKKLITEMMKRESRFLSAGEIRKYLKASSHVYTQLSYLKKSGFLDMKVLDGRAYYGLKEWSNKR